MKKRDLVIGRDVRQPVHDSQNSASLKLRVDNILHYSLRLAVQAACR